MKSVHVACLLYTSDAADEEDSVDLCGRRIIEKKEKKRKKKKKKKIKNQIHNMYDKKKCNITDKEIPE